MNLEQDKLDLIERIIKASPKFASNEDLYEDFFNETCKRSLGIIEIVSSGAALEAYLRKIATTSIINVLKDSGRLRRTKSGYTPTNEVLIDTTAKYAELEVSYSNFKVEKSPEEFVIFQDTIDKVSDSILKINNLEPEKQYLQIYKLRYDKGMTQKEISDELGLSQSEVSKRLFKLMEKVKQSFR